MPAQAGIQPWLCRCSGDSEILDSRPTLLRGQAFRGNDGIPARFAVKYVTVITNGSTKFPTEASEAYEHSGESDREYP